jgi:hypothetical protein
MNLIKPILKLHMIDSKFSYTIFWSILITVSIVAVLLVASMTKGSLYFGSNIAVYIYLMIHAKVALKETFPYALGMGSTRKHYYLGTILFYILFAVLTASIQNLFNITGEFLFRLINLESIHLTHLGLLDALAGHGWLIFWFDVLMALFIITLSHFIACIDYRYGLIPVLILLGFILLSIITPGLQDIWFNLFNLLSHVHWVFIFSSLFLLSITALFSLDWLVLQRASITSARG